MNDVFITFLGSLTTLITCMLVGFIGRKLRVFDDALINAMSTLLIKVTLPCTVFASMLRPFSATLLAESTATFFLSALLFLAGGGLAWLLAYALKVDDAERRVWQFSLIFANVGYMGFPVCLALFGEEGLIYTAMANAAFNVLLFTVGVRLFANYTVGWRKIIFNPAIIATVLGFFCFVSKLHPPWPINDAASMLGGMTSPISMLLVGSILAKSSLRGLFYDWRIAPVMAARLLVIPIAAYFTLRLFVHNSTMLGVIVVLSAMPVAAITAIFAEQYKGDTALASKLVVLSTLLCAATLPLMTLLINL